MTLYHVLCQWHATRGVNVDAFIHDVYMIQVPPCCLYSTDSLLSVTGAKNLGCSFRCRYVHSTHRPLPKHYCSIATRYGSHLFNRVLRSLPYPNTLLTSSCVVFRRADRCSRFSNLADNWRQPCLLLVSGPFAFRGRSCLCRVLSAMHVDDADRQSIQTKPSLVHLFYSVWYIP